MSYSILVDVTKCTGCEQCVNACIDANGQNKLKADFDRATSMDGLSDSRLLSIIDAGDGRYVRKSCMHCLEPACVAACLVGGITKTKEGPVVYDADKCIGCRYCMISRPFHIPRYEWNETTPFMKKCRMCHDRLVGGQLPACVAACPRGAIEFGKRSEMLARAHSIIDANKSKYINRVWGENEFGGTSVIYISDTDLAAIGWPKQNTESIPEITDPIIEKTPYIGGGVMLSMLGLNWIIGRRRRIAEEKKNNTGYTVDGKGGH
ncbi:MAG: 4Fe-4S dicluster domain-containing protein [Candidatus Kapaibacterium sp.]